MPEGRWQLKHKANNRDDETGKKNKQFLRKGKTHFEVLIYAWLKLTLERVFPGNIET
jgi:hypothetical protein